MFRVRMIVRWVWIAGGIALMSIVGNLPYFGFWVGLAFYVAIALFGLMGYWLGYEDRSCDDPARGEEDS